MVVSKQADQTVTVILTRALELTQEALSQLTRIAIEEIRSGLEAGNHVEAAERDMRSALRQLVLAERELRDRSARRGGADKRAGEIAEVVPGPGSGAARSA